ncbi:hypothetical protein COL91_18910 [Bacillus pseudomycoides]|nr:hypothetical protein COO02_01580 [Bacillus pseudomycoides]PGA89109.1 hypothetical protein COL91_18910 [Bacillus pseudomycoides]PHF46672.1 hypothetical protein COF72_11770 [Bacillus pseudomycoides]
MKKEGYKYTTDELGRIVEVEAENLILKKGKRNKGMQVVVGRPNRLKTDDGFISDLYRSLIKCFRL